MGCTQVHPVKSKYDELVLVRKRVLPTSLPHPISGSGPFSSNLIPHRTPVVPPTLVLSQCVDLGSSFIPSAYVLFHHVVLLHLRTSLKELITALEDPSQTHPIARHKFAAISSFRKGRPICTHIFLQFCNTACCRPPTFHPSFLQNGRAAS